MCVTSIYVRIIHGYHIKESATCSALLNILKRSTQTPETPKPLGTGSPFQEKPPGALAAKGGGCPRASRRSVPMTAEESQNTIPAFIPGGNHDNPIKKF